jgi:hypothetical protein
METVYKFCGCHGIDILRNLELKVTPPNQFNDSFEFTPKTYVSDPVSFSMPFLEDEAFVKEFYPRCGYPGTEQEFKELAKVNPRKLIDRLIGFDDGHFEDEKRILDDLSKKVGVLCMSAARDSILMWGHYCDKSLGIVVGFDRSCAIFKQGTMLKPVEYVKQRPRLDLCWAENSAEREYFRDAITFHKSDAWRYETEFRKVFVLASPQMEEKPLADGTPGYFLKFPPEAIVSATLGPRVSVECETDVKNVLQRPHFSHVSLDRAILDRGEFKLEFVPVK